VTETNNHPEARGAVVVAKVGGSLLDWPDLPVRLRSWLETMSASGSRPVLLAGGGALADAVRWLDATHEIGPERAHWLAVRALDLAAHALAAIVPGVVVISGLDEIGPAHARGETPVFAPTRFLRDDEDQDDPDALPQDWTVTSDSIAARLASVLNADALVLLKSASPTPGLDRISAARAGLIDLAFPRASDGLETVLVLNLRDMEAGPATPLPRA
jgi:aspartokinase-like uncharacterized kinase